MRAHALNANAHCAHTHLNHNNKNDKKPDLFYSLLYFLFCDCVLLQWMRSFSKCLILIANICRYDVGQLFILSFIGRVFFLVFIFFAFACMYFSLFAFSDPGIYLCVVWAAYLTDWQTDRHNTQGNSFIIISFSVLYLFPFSHSS